MANNTGTLVTSPIRPQSDQDTFATAFASEIKGGHRTVATMADLALIPTPRLEEGMSCFVQAEGATYTLIGSQWVDLIARKVAQLPTADVSDADALTKGTIKEALLPVSVALTNRVNVFTPLVTATDNNQQIVGLSINPTFDFAGHYNINTRALHVRGNVGVDAGSLFLNDGSLYTTFVRSNGGHLVFGNDNADYGRFFGNGNFRIGGNWVDVGYRFSVAGSALIESPEGLTIRNPTPNGGYGFKALNLEGVSGIGGASGGIAFKNDTPNGATPLSFNNDIGTFFQMWGGGSANTTSPNAMLFQFVTGNADFRVYEASKQFRVYGASYSVDDLTYTPGTKTLSVGNFIGNGSGLASLNGSNISTGTVPDDRLSSNIPQKNKENIYTNTTRLNGFVRSAPDLPAFNGSLTSISFTPTLRSTANGDSITAVDIRPTFINGSFTGVTTRALRVAGPVEIETGNLFMSNGNLAMSTTSNIYVNYYRNNGGDIVLGSSAGAQWMRIFQSSGNVNIGTSTADQGYRLHVEGTSYFSGTMTAVNLSVPGQLNGGTISATGNMGANGYMRTGGVLAVGVLDYTTMDNSAIAEFRSTTQGILPPRMTAAQMAAIANPKDSLIAFQTDGVKGLYIYMDGSWKRLAIAA